MSFLPGAKSRRKLKKALASAQDETVSLKEQLRALEESNEQLRAEKVAGGTDRVESAPELNDAAGICAVENKEGRSFSSTRNETEQGVPAPEEVVTKEKGTTPQIENNEQSYQNSGEDDKQQEGTVPPKQELQSDNVASHVSWEDDEGGEKSVRQSKEVPKTIGQLSKRNQELEATVARLESKLAAREGNEGNAATNLDTTHQAQSHNNWDSEEGWEASKIRELTKQNQVLETNMAALAEEKNKLSALLTKEKNKSIQRRKEAKERRKKFESKLANMSEKLKEGFGDDFEEADDVDTSFDDNTAASGDNKDASFTSEKTL